jgi:hypothetical protein
MTDSVEDGNKVLGILPLVMNEATKELLIMMARCLAYLVGGGVGWLCRWGMMLG